MKKFFQFILCCLMVVVLFTTTTSAQQNDQILGKGRELLNGYTQKPQPPAQPDKTPDQLWQEFYQAKAVSAQQKADEFNARFKSKPQSQQQPQQPSLEEARSKFAVKLDEAKELELRKSVGQSKTTSLVGATVSGTVYNDLNSNGVKDAGESGLQGWTINAYPYYSGGSYSAISDVDGNYTLTFSPFYYGYDYVYVVETTQSGWLVSNPSGGYYNYPLFYDNNNYPGYNFGNYQLQPSTFSGVKFHDLDGDGVKDAGEPGLPGWVIHVNNTYFDTTDANGDYSISAPVIGSVTLGEQLQAGWEQSLPGNNFTINVTNGSTHSNRNFGNWQPPLRVNTMPSYGVNGAYGNGLANQALTIWGNVDGGTPPYQYWLDYGDGNIDSGTVSNPHFIGAPHTYTTAGTRTMTLTVKDAVNAVDVDQSTIRIYAASTPQIETNMAIEHGLLYLYLNQQPNGSWTGDSYSYIGSTGLPLLSFEENGHLPTNDFNTDIYAEFVRMGLNYMLNLSSTMSISAQTAGNPDSDGDGLGAYLNYDNYANGVGLLALVAAHRTAASAQADIIRNGPHAGQSYYAFMVDAIDQLAYSQSESGNQRGGWRYNINTADYGSSDNSAVQWSALVFEAAQSTWGMTIPQFVKDELLIWLQYSQNANGGFGYTSGSEWLNIAKTGAGIVSLVSIGANSSNAAVVNAISFLDNNWDAGTYHESPDHKNGNMYAMYSVTKGMRLLDNRTGVTNVGSHNWYEEYRDVLLHHPTNGQQANGSWNDYYWVNGATNMGTAFGVLVLTQGVVVPPPIAVIDPISSKPPNTAFQVKGSNSYHLDPSKTIIEYLWDFDAADGTDFESPDAVGLNPTNPGYASNGTYTITLRVKDNSSPALYDLETATVVISNEANHAPVAVAIPPGGAPAYAGRVGEPILLDGSTSYDPDAPNDSVVAYNWDTNGDGMYGDANTDTATVVFANEYNGQVGLRVYDSHGDSSSNNAYITIVASRKDLYVESFAITENAVNAGSDIHLSATFKNDATSNSNVSNALVRFYSGNPFTTGTQIGSDSYVNLPIGASSTVNLTYTIPAIQPNGSMQFYAYIDPTLSIDEWDEANNYASDSVTIGIVCEPETTYFSASACSLYTLPWGGTVSESGNYTHTYSGSDECDSVVVAQVTINPNVSTEFSATACNSYELPWGGEPVTTSGDYSHTYQTVNGCDSVVTAHVTINLSTSSEFSATACDTYSLPWDTTVTTSGDYSHKFVGSNGCDSTVTAHITINYGAATEFSVSTEQNPYELPWGQMVTSSGDYSHAYVAANGCDSVVTAHVTILQGSISGTKYNDKNGNGSRDEGDNGLAGWVINLTGSATASATTDANGNYSFSNLTSGTYTVREVAQNGWTQTSTNPADINLTAGQNVSGVNFGNFQSVSLPVWKIGDSDGDGIHDDNEQGLSGWTIVATKGVSTKTVVTNANGTGSFTFGPSDAGTWTITEQMQNGWIRSFPQSGSHSVTVQSGSVSIADATFMNYQPASISGKKYEDIAGDSVTASDPTLNGWVIELYNGETLVAKDTTSGDGDYMFSNLAPGTYTVSEVLQSGWIQTIPASGSYAVTISSGSNVSGKDFANFKLGSISGTKYQDTDGDSTIDAGEPTLQGWLIQLWNGNSLVAEDSSDANGEYSFGGLTAGTYDVSEVQPSDDWYHTIPSTDSYTLSVTSGSVYAGKDFANVQFGTVSGYKFRDYDSTGTFDEVCEEYLAGQKIVLVGSHTAPETTVTDENGNFSFDPVPADNYTLKEAGDSYWRQTKPANGNPYSFQLLSNEDESGYVFGNFFILDTTKFRTFTVREYNKSAGARQKSGFAKKPTGGNVRDSVHINRGFDSPTGYMLAGVERPDSSLIYGWYYYKLDALHPYKASAAKHWLYNDQKLKYDSRKQKQKYPTDYITAYGENVAESEIGNALNYGQILFLTFKTNIAASDLGITTPGYGELVYACPKNADFSDSVLVGKTLREISHFYDTVLTMGRKIVKLSASVSDTTYRYGRSYLRVLDSVMLRLNKEFSQDLSKSLSTTNAVVDTISTKPLAVKGRKSLYKASYLHSIPEVAFSLQRFERKFGQSDVQPLTYRLEQNYPNPFNPMTMIQFELEVPSNVTLKIFNLLGQEIGSLLNNQELEEGLQEIEFDATSLPTGVYFYRLEAEGLDADGIKHTFNSVKKMMLVR
ncbi:MAG: carboxypeptidase regulatory-like domain-containing protein [Ignavibacteriae bacterium]|nr:carboxypeptidase regulatory-like domain-containing protein [Ignavibacteriota bacterium]